jgi:hypothetical protein
MVCQVFLYEYCPPTEYIYQSPGRFFAANELKAMLAHVLLTYDLKMTDTARDTHFGINTIPDTKAEVWFRKRRV